MAYSDEHRVEAMAETKRRQNSKKMYTFEIFARLYVNLGQNGMEATRQTFPTIKNETLIRLEKNKLMQNPYVMSTIEQLKKEALLEAGLTPGRIASEFWSQYNKYKNDPKKWQAAIASLTGLTKLMPKQAPEDDGSKSTGGGVNIFINKQLEVGATVRQPDYSEIPAELLDVTKDIEPDAEDTKDTSDD